MKHTLAQCDAELARVYPGNAQAQEGETWTCSCGNVFYHVCDEAEGCFWAFLHVKAKARK